MRIRNPTDFLTGLLFGSFGLSVSIYAATHYQLGTAVRMGPGYFPTWVGGLVTILGFVLALRALRWEGPSLARLHWRPTLLVLAGTIAFGYLLKPLGLVLATIVMVIISAFGGHEFRWKEVLPLAIGLAVFGWVVFVYALGLPFPLWPAAFLE